MAELKGGKEYSRRPGKHMVMVYMPDALYAILQKDAVENERSVSSSVVFYLKHCLRSVSEGKA